MIRKRDIDIINRTIKVADKSKLDGQYTMASSLALGKRIISTGINDYSRTHSNTPQIYSTHTIPVHAEVDCLSRWIVKNRKVSEDMTLYIVGYTKANDCNFVVSSFPCESCMSFILKCGISRIVYMVNNDNIVNIIEHLI